MSTLSPLGPLCEERDRLLHQGIDFHITVVHCHVACSRYTIGILAQSALPLSPRRSPTWKAMIWRVVASMAIQIHCLLAFFCTKLHISSASASNLDITTAVGRAGSWTWRSSGQAVKHSTIKCKSHVRLTPTARQIPRSETRSHNRCSTLVRRSSAMRRSLAVALNWRSHALH